LELAGRTIFDKQEVKQKEKAENFRMFQLIDY